MTQLTWLKRPFLIAACILLSAAPGRAQQPAASGPATLPPGLQDRGGDHPRDGNQGTGLSLGTGVPAERGHAGHRAVAEHSPNHPERRPGSDANHRVASGHHEHAARHRRRGRRHPSAFCGEPAGLRRVLEAQAWHRRREDGGPGAWTLRRRRHAHRCARDLRVDLVDGRPRRRAHRVRPRRQDLHGGRRTGLHRSCRRCVVGTGSGGVRRQGAPVERRWERAGGQPVRRTARVQAGDLRAGHSQCHRVDRAPGDR